MSYRRTKTLSQVTGTGKPANVAPEDDWNLAANPSVFLDELPQPYKFINSCLQEMILKPVSQKITTIEDRKKTTEYEGFIKESPATCHMDIEQTTVLHQVSPSVGPGGLIDKAEQSYITSKIIAGDNYG